MKVTDHWGERKYYSTLLSVELLDGRTVSVEVSSSDPEPSWREKHENREMAAIGEWPCDGHYEREATSLVVGIIKGALTTVTNL